MSDITPTGSRIDDAELASRRVCALCDEPLEDSVTLMVVFSNAVGTRTVRVHARCQKAVNRVIARGSCFNPDHPQ